MHKLWSLLWSLFEMYNIFFPVCQLVRRVLHDEMVTILGT